MIDCDHGPDAFCWYSMSEDQRKTFDFMFRHAFEWASEHTAAYLDEIEGYASHYAARFYRDDPECWTSHPLEYERWSNTR